MKFCGVSFVKKFCFWIFCGLLLVVVESGSDLSGERSKQSLSEKGIEERRNNREGGDDGCDGDDVYVDV